MSAALECMTFMISVLYLPVLFLSLFPLGGRDMMCSAFCAEKSVSGFSAFMTCELVIGFDPELFIGSVGRPFRFFHDGEGVLIITKKRRPCHQGRSTALIDSRWKAPRPSAGLRAVQLRQYKTYSDRVFAKENSFLFGYWLKWEL